jgi:hypothetical protein
LQKAFVVLADLSRLFKRSGAFCVQAPKIHLHIFNVDLKVLPYQVSKFGYCIPVVGHKWTHRRQACLGIRSPHDNKRQYYSLREKLQSLHLHAQISYTGRALSSFIGFGEGMPLGWPHQ